MKQYNSLSEYILYLYNSFNKKEFSRIIDFIPGFGSFITLVYQGFNQKPPAYNYSLLDNKCPRIHENENNKVLLGFSGGLDSVYQYLKLKEEGYDVYLYNVKSINKYENGQADKACADIIEALSIRDKFISVKIPFGSNKEWAENPIKNQLILAYMIDYCVDNDIYNISLGDDEGLLLSDATPGINFTDAKEVTEVFLNSVKKSIGLDINYIPLKFISKLERISKLKEYNLENKFYSCITAGRFNRYRHDCSEKKYNIKLLEHNCGCYCRKCAMHNLLIHYGKVQEFPKEFIDKCWKIMYNNGFSSEYKFFNPNISEEERIKNLFTT